MSPKSPFIANDSDSDSSVAEKYYELPTHARKNCCFRHSYKIVSHPLFNMIIILMILASIVVLSMDSVHITEE